MRTEIPVFIKEVSSGKAVAAELIVGLSKDEVDEAAGLWSPQMRAFIQKNGRTPAHAHWNWSEKVRYIEGVNGYVVAGIKADDEIQAMLLWDDIASRARYPSQLGQELVYVHFVSTAPWNDRELTSEPKFGSTGTILVAAAVAHSMGLEFKGRIGLHSLSGAETFYRDNCKMIDMGHDVAHQNLRYFEFTPQLGQDLLTRTGVKL